MSKLPVEYTEYDQEYCTPAIVRQLETMNKALQTENEILRHKLKQMKAEVENNDS